MGKHNSLHREDGPAVIHPNGTVDYWIDGKWIDPEIMINDFQFQIKYPKVFEHMVLNSVYNS